MKGEKREMRGEWGVSVWVRVDMGERLVVGVGGCGAERGWVLAWVRVN